MSEEHANDKKSLVPLWIALVVCMVLLSLYVFSAVPVLNMFVKHTGNVPDAVVTFYAPLDWLYQNSTVARSLFDAQARAMGYK
jgi:hypothetical protein